jgi:Uncharacterized protein conserved in bacteria (DUF2188)
MLGRHVYRVKPKDDSAWTVRKDGEDAARGERGRRREAIDFACELAAADEPSKVVVENDDGTIAEERVFGVDQGQLVDDTMPDGTRIQGG